MREELNLKLSKLLFINKNGIHFKNKRFTISRPNIDKFNINAYDRNKILKSYPGNTNVLQICKNYLPIDIAATGEFVLKKIFLKNLEKLRKLTKSENLVCSGGLFQNVALNQKIINSGIFKNHHFPMANSDAGLSLGAAFYVKYIKKKIKERKKYLNPYLGPSFDNKEVEAEIKRFKLISDYKKDKDICKITAKLILKGFIVGWFQGRAEYGPRSLGNRSILADPTKINSKLKVNQLLKKRDWFMPYAPSVSYEFINQITDDNFYSPYMQSAFNIKDSFKKKIPAAVHVDGTSRIHVVKRNENKLYWTLLNEVKKINGMPIVLNTSFNRHGISTISSPRQAIEHALEGCMDYLVINNYLVDVKKNRFFAKKFAKITSEFSNIKNDSFSRIKILKKKKISFSIKKYKVYLDQIKLKKFIEFF
jgi:carbamoyltransferase